MPVLPKKIYPWCGRQRQWIFCEAPIGGKDVAIFGAVSTPSWRVPIQQFQAVALKTKVSAGLE
jgi:hypothetical protein